MHTIHTDVHTFQTHTPHRCKPLHTDMHTLHLETPQIHTPHRRNTLHIDTPQMHTLTDMHTFHTHYTYAHTPHRHVHTPHTLCTNAVVSKSWKGISVMTYTFNGIKIRFQSRMVYLHIHIFKCTSIALQSATTKIQLVLTTKKAWYKKSR